MIKIIDDDELDEIMIRTCAGSGPLEPEELVKRAQRVLDWATQVRLDQAVLAMVLSGQMDVVVGENPDDPIKFRFAEDAPKADKTSC